MFKKIKHNLEIEPFILIPVLLSLLFAIIFIAIISPIIPWLISNCSYECEILNEYANSLNRNEFITYFIFNWGTIISVFIWSIFWLPFFVIKFED